MREELDRVKKILANHPKGLTISDVSQAIGINRNAVAKYLEVLRTAGEVEMRSFGRSRIYSLSSRLPLATALSLSSDLIVLIDGDLRVLDVNDQFLRFTGLGRDWIVGQALEGIYSDILTHPNILLNIKDALNGKEYVHEINAVRGKDDHYFKIKLIPVAMSGAQRRVAIIYENITARKKAELALRESEARYRAVVEDQTELIVRMLPDSTITFVNDAWCRFFDDTREQVLGKRQIDLVPARYRAALQRDLESIRANRPSLTVESDLTLPDGKRRWIQSTYRGTFDGKDRLAEVQIVTRDVTDRKLAELALGESEARYRAVVDSQTELIGRIRADTTVLFVNEAWCKYWGVDAGNVVGTKLSDRMPPEQMARLGVQLAGIRSANDVGVYDEMARRPDGAPCWLQWMYRGTFDEQGRLMEYQLVARDTTDRKRAEIGLQESEARYRAVVEDQTDHIMRIGPDMAIHFVNEAWCWFWKISRSDAAGQKLTDFMPPEAQATMREKLGQIGEGRVSDSYEELVWAPDGRQHWFQWTYRGIFGEDGRIKEYQIAGRDVTARKQAEIALRESEARYRAVVEDQVDMIMRIRPDMTFTFANQACYRYWGAGPSIIPDARLIDFLPPATQAKIGRAIGAIRQENDIMSGEDVLVHADGSQRWLQWTCRGIFDGAGRLAEYQLVARDVTDRKQAEIALIESEARYRAVVESQWELIGRFRPDTTITFVNEAWCRFWGNDRKDVIGKKLSEQMSERHIATLKERLKGIRGKDDLVLYEMRTRRRDGTHRWLQWTYRGIFDGQGDVAEYQFTVLDITDRKRVELALQESEEMFRALADSSQAGIVLIREEKVVYINRALADMGGYTVEESLGKAFVEFIHPDFRTVLWERGLAAQHDGKITHHRYEAKIVGKDGRERWIDSSPGLITYNGMPALIVTAIDITERKRAEQALVESEARYRAVVESQTDLIMRMLPDTTITFLNEACSAYFGMEIADLMGRRFLEMLPPGHRERVAGLLERVRPDARYGFSEDSTVPAGPAQRWLHWTYCGIFDDRGDLKEYQIVARDITDRKLAETALRESEANFRNIYGHAPIGICWMSVDFRFLSVNPEMCRITGYDEAELIGKTLSDISHPDDREQGLGAAQAVASGLGEHYQIDKRYVRKDGRVHWMRINGRLMKGPAGQPPNFIVMIEDITERKQLMESLRITQTSVDQAVDEIIWAGKDGHLLYVNDAACRKLGYAREELLGMDIWDIDPWFVPERYAALMDDIRRHGHQEFEGIHLTKAGEVYPVEITAIHQPWGNEERLCAFVRDVSARKRTEATLKLYRLTFEDAPVSVCWLRPDGSFLQVNQTLCRRLGYDSGEVLSLSVFDICPQITRQVWVEMWLKINEDGSVRLDTECRAKDGSVLTVEATANLVAFDGEQYICVFARDISVRKQTEVSLKLYRFTMEGVSDAIGWLRPDGGFVEVNDAMCQMLGGPRDALLARDIYDFCPQLDRRKWREHAEMIGKVAPIRVEMAFTAADGARVPVEISLSRLTAGGSEYNCIIARRIMEPQRAGAVLAAGVVRSLKDPALPDDR